MSAKKTLKKLKKSSKEAGKTDKKIGESTPVGSSASEIAKESKKK